METQTAYPMTLNEKRIVVLGGTSGIGFATAEMAAREGAAIVVASSRRENVDRAVARLPKGTEGYAIDLSNEEHVPTRRPCKVTPPLMKKDRMKRCSDREIVRKLCLRARPRD